MERVTIKTEKGAALKMGDTYPSEDAARKDLMRRYRIAVDRLAAYEDTGLEPGEVLTGKELAEVGCAIIRLKEYQDIGSIAHLRELAQAEMDGRLVVMPCRVGDTVHIIRGEAIITATAEAIHQWCSRKWKINVHTDNRHTHWVGYEICLDDFCKTVFLTREEAEEALKKREADNERI